MARRYVRDNIGRFATSGGARSRIGGTAAGANLRGSAGNGKYSSDVKRYGGAGDRKALKSAADYKRNSAQSNALNAKNEANLQYLFRRSNASGVLSAAGSNKAISPAEFHRHNARVRREVTARGARQNSLNRAQLKAGKSTLSQKATRIKKGR